MRGCPLRAALARYVGEHLLHRGLHVKDHLVLFGGIHAPRLARRFTRVWRRAGWRGGRLRHLSGLMRVTTEAMDELAQSEISEAERLTVAFDEAVRGLEQGCRDRDLARQKE